MPDEEHVEVGEIVLLDHIVILEGEEGRAVGAFGQQQRRRLAQFGRRRLAAIGEHVALLEPLGERLRDIGHADGAIDALRHAHLVGPGRAALPALPDQLGRRRGERIRYRMPDVLLAVAVEIDTILVVLGRQELGEAHGAAP